MSEGREKMKTNAAVLKIIQLQWARPRPAGSNTTATTMITAITITTYGMYIYLLHDDMVSEVTVIKFK